jgi:hypothetical protein
MNLSISGFHGSSEYDRPGIFDVIVSTSPGRLSSAPGVNHGLFNKSPAKIPSSVRRLWDFQWDEDGRTFDASDQI